MQKNTRTIREELELNEKNVLSEFASFSVNSTRKLEEEKCPFRTEFQRDRDRILHSQAFRRLKRKTQVFLSDSGDDFRTRLTHTLEVSQIARTISRSLKLNEDLTEAIALGHDLGHSPFGHAGEWILNKICPHGYKHYLQSVRVVEHLERDGKGLNLTNEVIDGIKCHTNMTAKTLEGQIVRLADTIAYINHDIDDAIKVGVLKDEQIPPHLIEILGDTKSKRITTFVSDIINNGAEKIFMSPEIRLAHDELKQFMFDNVYLTPEINSENKKCEDIIAQLYAYYLKHAEKLPELYRKIADKTDVDRAVCDFLGGMTDNYIVSLYKQIFIPSCWNNIMSMYNE
jgi:dGTPase